MRDLNTPVLDELDESTEIHILPLAEFDFVEGTVFVWAGPEGHAIGYNGDTYTSLSDIGQIDKISEAQGLSNSRTTVSLRIGSDSPVDKISGSDSRGRDAVLRLLLVTDQTEGIGVIEFFKTIGALRVQSNASGSRKEGDLEIQDSIEMDLLDETWRLENSHFVRMTYEQGLRIDSDDHGLEFVSQPDIGNLNGLDDARARRRSIDQLMDEMDRASRSY